MNAYRIRLAPFIVIADDDEHAIDVAFEVMRNYADVDELDASMLPDHTVVGTENGVTVPIGSLRRKP